MPSIDYGKEKFRRQLFWGGVATLTVVGILLLGINELVLSVENLRLERAIFRFIPIIIAVLVYIHTLPNVSRWEVVIAGGWGLVSAAVGGPLAYFFFGGLYEHDPHSIKLLLDSILRFLLTTSLASGIFMTAATFRDHPLRSAVILLLTPLAWFLPFAVIFLIR